MLSIGKDGWRIRNFAMWKMKALAAKMEIVLMQVVTEMSRPYQLREIHLRDLYAFSTSP